MNFKLTLLILLIHCSIFTELSAQNRRSSTPTPTKTVRAAKPSAKLQPVQVPVDTPKPFIRSISGTSRWGIQIELGALPVQSLNSSTLNSYCGSLGLNYNLFSKFHIGLFGQTLLYHQNIDVANIDNKIIDLSSIEYNSVGLRLIYKLPIGKLSVCPQVDAAYNFFISKAIDFSEDKKAFLDYRYVTVTPKLNLGFNITESTTLGLFGGYNYQLTAIKGKKLEEFNPTGIMGGMTMNIQIVK
jgi:hypothetical protein